MEDTSAQRIVTAFNDCITRRDIDGLSRLMTDRHVFINSEGNAVSGKQACVAAWAGFFEAFPDYHNILERFLFADGKVVMIGRSICSDRRLDGPALWTAKVDGTRVAKWRVYTDTLANRALLGVMD